MVAFMVEKLLKKKKLRFTEFRNEVLNVFIDSSNAISINDIEDKLKQFDRTTLYRTIKTFKEKGLIHEIIMPGDIKKLALCKDGGSSKSQVDTSQHIHFRCKMCENIFCLDLDEFPEINIPQFKLDSIEIQGTGRCNTC